MPDDFICADLRKRPKEEHSKAYLLQPLVAVLHHLGQNVLRGAVEHSIDVGELGRAENGVGGPLFLRSAILAFEKDMVAIVCVLEECTKHIFVEWKVEVWEYGDFA